MVGMRIPSLDGIRAIAASFVIVGHMGNDYDIPNPFEIEGLGVRIFFVLSGFLITGLLLFELDETGRISPRRFYLRRTLRIFPAFYTYIGVMLIVSAFGWSPLTLKGAIPALTYTSNFWSMGVESGFAVSQLGRFQSRSNFIFFGLRCCCCPVES